MTDEEFEELWAWLKERDKKRCAEYDALPEEEKQRREREFEENGYERFTDNPLGSDDEDDAD